MSLPTQSIGGLVSGFDTANIIESLMSIERRPIKMMESKITELEGKQEGYQAINRMLLEFKNQVDTLGKLQTYNAKTASSSNESILKATAYDSAIVGSYSFRVARTAQTHQLISNGYSSNADTAVGAGEIRIDQAGASLRQQTKINEINGNTGMFRGSIKISDRSGNNATIDLSLAETVQDVIDTINNTSGIKVKASINDTYTGINLEDISGSLANNLIVEETNAGTTAADLGIITSATGLASSSLAGTDIYTLSGTNSLAWLRDGQGIDNGTLGKIQITDDTTATDYEIDLTDASTVNDVLAAINNAGGGGIFSAAVNGKGIEITSDLGNDFTIVNDPSVASDLTATHLGIAGSSTAGSMQGSDLIGGMNTVMVDSLSGVNGTGIGTLGQVSITDRLGNSVTVDISGQTTLQGIIDKINTDAAAAGTPVQVQVALNNAGNGIKLTDTSGGSGNLTISDSTGTAATNLGLVVDAKVDSVNGGDLDRKYISLATKLSDLNRGDGVFEGSIRLIDSTGASATGNLSGLKTVGDVIVAINNAGLSMQAQINSTGDGIEIINTAGSGTIKIEQVGTGTTAEDLNILGSAAAGASIDGSFEKVINIDANDNLNDVVYKVGMAEAGIRASIINDGSGLNPYHLSFNSSDSGLAGRLVIDTSISGLNFKEGAKAQDAAMLYGEAGSGVSPMLVTSSSNSFNGLIPGMSITASAADPTKSVTVSVDRDVEAVAESAEALVGAYNNLNEIVNVLTRWDKENEVPGLLFGDSTVSNLMNSLSDMMLEQVDGLAGGISQWYDIGFEFKFDQKENDEGDLELKSYMELDSAKLLAALNNNFEGVRDLMTKSSDLARQNLNAAVTTSNPAGGGTSVDNLLNGNISAADFGTDNGYQGTNPVNNDEILVQLDKPREIYQLAIHHIDSATMPAEDYAISDFMVEYFDTLSKSWKEARSYNNNTAPINYITLPTGARTDQIKITVKDTNAADKLARLVEVEAFERQGVASKMRSNLDQVTDINEGIFAIADDTIDSKIKDLEASIENQEARMEQKEISLLREYTAMEQAMAQMQSQSDFLSSQLNAMNSKK